MIRRAGPAPPPPPTVGAGAAIALAAPVFGLRLENGAVLKLDDRDLGHGVRFSACVPSGCLLPVSFPTVATDALKAGQRLTVAALNIAGGEAVTFNVLLNGFPAAFARVVQLGD